MQTDDTPKPARGTRSKKGSPRKRSTAKATAVEQAASVEVLPAAVAEDVIEKLIHRLDDLQRSETFSFARKAGRDIVDTFYNGDLGAWRTHGPKDSSFRRLADLAEKKGLNLSPTTLYRCVALVEVEDRLGPLDAKKLSFTHAREVFGLPEKEQTRLLTTAAEKDWSIEDMAKAAAKVRKKEGDGRGRPALPTFVKSIHALGRLIAEDDGDPFADIDDLDQISDEDAEKLWKTVTGVKLKCEELQKKLQVKVPGFGMRGE